jgi:uncharacterized membrane protein
MTTEDDTRIDRATGEEADEDRGRFLAFSDGVFAFAATLLAVSLAAPVLRPDQLSELPGRLRDLRPQVLAYAISFLVVSSFWGAHRQIFRRIPRLDDALIAMNSALLMLIAVLPFPTAVLGLYSSVPIAVVLYAATLTAISLLLVIVRMYALSKNLMRRAASPDLHRVQTVRSLVFPAVFAGSIPVAYYARSPSWAMYSWLLLIPLNMLLNRLPRRKPVQRTERPSG